MTTGQIESQVSALVAGQSPKSFRERMMLQMQVIDSLSNVWHIDTLEATTMIAPVFAKLVPHIQ